MLMSGSVVYKEVKKLHVLSRRLRLKQPEKNKPDSRRQDHVFRLTIALLLTSC